MRNNFFKYFLLITFLSAAVFAQENGFYDQVNYKGAFGSSNWLEGWTAVDHYGYSTVTPAVGGPVETITDDDIQAGQTIYWTADKTYLLDGLVYVEDGAILNIEAGTVVKAKAGDGEDASALIISQGGKIYAEGTAARPIIFTGESDDVTDPTDLPLPTSNLWGGLIILGKAPINTSNGFGFIEGITENEKSRYGGNDPADNSGVLRYVSIRHGGTKLGSGDEINGLTLGGVGNGTTIEFVEVFNNEDDGFEWFGGTVNCKYLVSAFNADDAFDHDEGLQSKMQFLFAIYDENSGNRSGEHDGGTDPEDGEPFAFPQVYNATFLGSGVGSSNADNDYTFKIRDNWGGLYRNSIFGDAPGAAMDIEDLDSGQDSKQRLDDGEIVFENNLFFDYGAGSTFADLGAHDFEGAYLANDNAIENPNLGSITRTPYTQTLDPRPATDGPAYQNVAEINDMDPFYDHVNYKGAFGTTNWLEGWTAVDHYGYIVETPAPGGPEVVVTDGDINAGDDVYWTAENTYVLDGLVYVEDGATLNIEAGTIVKAKAGDGEDASALIISQGGKIYAQGTGINPIVFTGESDDVTDPTDLPLPTSNLWGGLILLGKAPINTSDGFGFIEGITENEKSRYGGIDGADNSGVLRYVSIRHGGTKLGSGDEINGLTLGGVGDKTRIDFVEVFNNEDDGFEWFGGTVNAKHLVSGFNADDAFDHDEGLQSKMQYLFAIYDENSGNRSGEHDGGTDPEDGTPFAFPQVYNATFLGSGVGSSNADNDYTFKIRDNWGGLYRNSIFGDAPGGAMDIEDLDSGQDSKQRLDDGQIVFEYNIWFNYGAGSTFADLGAHDYEGAYLASAPGNSIEDPMLSSITRAAYAQTLDPRPEADGPAYQNLGIITGVTEGRINDSIPQEFELSQNYPNPFNPTTTIKFSLPNGQNVKLAVYNILGQQVEILVDGFRNAGSYNVNWDASKLASGIYIYRLEAGATAVSKKMTLLK